MDCSKLLGPREAHKIDCKYRDDGDTCTCSRGNIESKEHEKLTQTFKPRPEDWQATVNRIISRGNRVRSMVYDIDGSRHTIDLVGDSITVEEL